MSSRLFGRVVLKSRFTQTDRFRFPSPQKMKTFYTAPTDMQKSVAHPTKKILIERDCARSTIFFRFQIGLTIWIHHSIMKNCDEHYLPSYWAPLGLDSLVCVMAGSGSGSLLAQMRLFDTTGHTDTQYSRLPTQ